MQALNVRSSYFSNFEKIDLSDLVKLTNHLDEQVEWQRILEFTGRELVNSIITQVYSGYSSTLQQFHL